MLLFGLASSPANKEPKIRLSLQMIGLTCTGAQAFAMENESLLSLVSVSTCPCWGEKADGLWTEKQEKGSH